MCDCGADDCPKCTPGCNTPVTCQACKDEFPAWSILTCDQCGAELCAACHAEHDCGQCQACGDWLAPDELQACGRCGERMCDTCAGEHDCYPHNDNEED